MGVVQFAGAAAKSEKAVGADGVVAAVLQAALDQAGGMPTPDAKSLTKAIKVALPTLKEVVTSEQKQIGVLGGMQARAVFAPWAFPHASPDCRSSSPPLALSLPISTEPVATQQLVV